MCCGLGRMVSSTEGEHKEWGAKSFDEGLTVVRGMSST